MRWFRVALAVLALSGVVACSSEKKVGSAIDLEKLAEKNQALGKIDAKKEAEGGFVGTAEQKQEQQAQANQTANQASQNAAIEKQKKAAAISFAITSSGYDPYVIRVFVGGRVSVTNRDVQARSVTADRGEFDSGPLAPGDTWSYEPKVPGTFNFHDSTRPFVVGKLEVLAS